MICNKQNGKCLSGYALVDKAQEKYADTKNMPRVLNGLGVAILSTSKGVMTDKEARAQKVGGEVLCHVY